ncbi:putative selenium metabolism protein, YedE family [Sphaerochaeta associata]|nr:putative selenium metabolism protein, YedE family [Sphaerochaeta associata]
MIVENIVAQMLVASGHKLYFYSNSSRDDALSRIEIDFLIAKSKVSNKHNISPIEVKSSKNYTLTSLQKFRAKFAQRTRLCMAGGIRDIFLFKDPTLLLGSAAVLVVALILNLATGSFKLGFTGQPIAHTQWLWNFLGMGLVGYGSVLLGGCPLRQTILAGEGNSDSAVTVLGFLAGAAVSHNFGLASSGQGATTAGKIATLVGFAVITLIALAVMKKQARS